MRTLRFVVSAFALLAFERAALAQCEVQQLTPAVQGISEQFGWSLAADGVSILVGAPSRRLGLVFPGTVVVFTRGAGAWSPTDEFVPDDAADGASFGSALALSGSDLVVGAYRDSGAGLHFGAAYVFERSGGAWSQRAKLLSDHGTVAGEFGASAAIDGDTLVVGATRENAFHGMVHVFERSGAIWNHVAWLGDPAGAADDYFGLAIALDGATLAVGSPGCDGTLADAGAVFVFERDLAGAWNPAAVLTPSVPQVGADFGRSLALEGDRLVVGADVEDGAVSTSGAVFAFERVGGVWTERQKLCMPQGRGLDHFGWSVALSGAQLLVGSLADDVSAKDTGAVQLFEHDGVGWSLVQKLGANLPWHDAELGSAVTFSGSLAVGAAIHDMGVGVLAGAAYAFDLDGSVERYCESSPNSAGNGAWMSTNGSTSVEANDFRLASEGVPPGKMGVFFYGLAPVHAPFGNGFLCIGAGSSGYFRLAPLPADVNGGSVRLLDFTQPPAGGGGAGAIAPGSTWCFQHWYRDPHVGAGFNLSDAIRATFCP